MIHNYPNQPICRHFVSPVISYVMTGGDKDKFGRHADRRIHSKCQPTDGKPTLNSLNFCTQVDYVKSQHKNDKSPLKRARSRSCDPLEVMRLPMISLEWLKLVSSNFAQGKLYQILAFKWQTTFERGMVTWPIFNIEGTRELPESELGQFLSFYWEKHSHHPPVRHSSWWSLQPLH